MPPPTMQQRYAGTQNNPPSHHQYPAYSQPSLPPPSLASAGYMNGPSMNQNPFANGSNSLNIGGNFGRPGPGMPGDTGLGSQHVMNSFAAAGIHQQNGLVDSGGRGAMNNKHRVRDVWASNLQEEIAVIRQLADDFPFIATNTVFPGVVARPMGAFNGKSDYHYQCMRCNVDLLKMMQLGITLFNVDGETIPPGTLAADLLMQHPREMPDYPLGATLPTTWQFHFKFSLTEDMYSESAIKSSQQAGIDTDRMATDGIDPMVFASLLITSGLVCDEDVHWLTCHGAYDLGHLTKLLSVLPLPDDETVFESRMSKFFPSIYDIKYVIKEGIRRHQVRELTPVDPSTGELLSKLEQKTRLDDLVDIFKIKRLGGHGQHSLQAGPASLYTGRVFFKLQERIFNGEVPREIAGKMWGIGPSSYGVSPEKQQGTPAHHNYNENDRPANGYANGGPSTPNTGNAGLVHTPGQHSNGGMGPITPGGVAGGPFSTMGAFTYGNK